MGLLPRGRALLLVRLDGHSGTHASSLRADTGNRLSLPFVDEWLQSARSAADAGDDKQALNWLYTGAWERPCAPSPTHLEAAELADALATRLRGGKRIRASELAKRHRERPAVNARLDAQREHEARLARIGNNLRVFAMLATDGDAPQARLRDHQRWADTRIRAWATSLANPFQVGYDAVHSLGRLVITNAERTELRHLLTETVNEVAIAAMTHIDDIAQVRRATPACFAYSLSLDDVRALEMLARFQRHTGTKVELPTAAVQSTLFLDAVENAQPRRDERPFFHSLSIAAFRVGVGAAIEDALADVDAAPVDAV